MSEQGTRFWIGIGSLLEGKTMQSKWLTRLVCSLLIAIPISFLPFARATSTSEQAEAPSLGVEELLANPEKFIGKTVEASGYLTIGFENYTLCPTAKSKYQNCVEVELDYGPINNYKDAMKAGAIDEKWHRCFSGRNLRLTGRFGGKRAGEIDHFFGNLKEISRVDGKPIESYACWSK